MTVLEVLSAASGYLREHGVESPRLNAEHLLAHVLGKKRLDLYLEFDRPLSDAERSALRELVRDRGTGKPLQHLLGTTAFFGRLFVSDSRALVPRPETEQLVELVLEDPRCHRGAGMAILDIGTGSGVIAITLALQRPLAAIAATDISSAALSLARENAARHSLNGKIAFHEADLFPHDEGRFDWIVANLPYIATAELAILQREVLHDPLVALDGGPDGLRLIRRLIEVASPRLAPGGILAMEIGHDQAAEVAGKLASQGYCDISLHQDYQGRERFVKASCPRPHLRRD
ncbi:MAG TPA: peptide chain release factor N(5)-glutamine methyltransferase [Terrimicrobiaceae bacterium]